jgi:NADH-quinone oxidoreductase subunit N
MNAVSFHALLPLLIPALGTVLLMLQIAFARSERWAYYLTLITLTAAAAAVPGMWGSPALAVTPLLMADDYARFFSLLFLVCSALTAILSRDYLRQRAGQNEEFFLLLLLATIGSVTLCYTTHLASLLLGLELMGVALYAMIAYPDRGTLALEAGIKYLVLSGAASSILLFGFALLYAALGTLEFGEMATRSQDIQGVDSLIYCAGIMIIAGLAFKLSLVPFHMWTPDVYEGAPAPVSGFLASVSKAAVFVATLRWFIESQAYQYQVLQTTLACLAVASMLAGNLMALRQDNVKRLLAYSSIAHMGYLLLTLVALGKAEPGLAVEAGAYYLVAYTATSLAAFSLLGLLSRNPGGTDSETDSGPDNDQLSQLTGLFWRQPALASLFSIALLSLAGIPLTAGFVGKFYIFMVGVQAELWALLSILVLGSAIGIYYYLRIIYTMSKPAPAPSGDYDATQGLSASANVLLYGLIFAMLYLGIAPEQLMTLLRSIL